jgi:hypothetical protein
MFRPNKGDRHHEGGGHGQHEAIGEVQPEIQGKYDTDDHAAQGDSAGGRQRRQAEGQCNAGQEQQHQLEAFGIVRLDQQFVVEQSGDHVGVDFHAGVGFIDRGCPQIQQTGRRGPEQHDLAA